MADDVVSSRFDPQQHSTVSPALVQSIGAEGPKTITSADWQKLAADMQAGNYGGAWNYANSFQSHNGQGYSTDPMMQALSTGAGINALGVKSMTPSQIQSFYKAAAPYYNDSGKGPGVSLGQNPYGPTEWGQYSNLAKDATQNASGAGGNASGVADIARYMGAQPTQSFVSKYGAPILAVIAACVAPELLPVLAPMLGGSMMAAGALYGAGVGALGGELSGGNVGKDALIGAITGGVGGSGALAAFNSGVGGAASSVLGDTAGDVVGDVAQGAASGALRSTLSGQGPVAGLETGAISGGTGAAGAGVTQGLGDVSNSYAGDVGSNLAGAATQSGLQAALQGQNVAPRVGTGMMNSGLQQTGQALFGGHG
jgi:hypothetical protein